jgi:phospholipid/cholesterol/gamma-HCH transport system substrate-binding protein
MERRAQVLLVGAFLLFTLLGLGVFLRWASPEEMPAAQERKIQFLGSVSGLSVGSEVRYLGVPAGQVVSIKLNRQQTGRVDVTVVSDELLPPSPNLVALLEAQGITGLSVIELRDRSDSYEVLDVQDGVIPGYPSVLSQVSGSAIAVARNADIILTRMSQLLNEQTVEDLSVAISQLRQLSSHLSSATSEMDALLGSVARVSAELETTLPAYRSLALRLDSEVIPTVMDAGQSLQQTSSAVAGIIADNREEMEQMFQQELPTLLGLSDEMSTALQELTKLLGNINDEPGALLYGENVTEVEIADD